MAHVLLVDDETDTLDSLGRALTLLGHSVDTAASSEKAIEFADRRGYSYDVAIVDYLLPGMRGLELVRKLREHNAFLRSIIISGQVDHETLTPLELERQLKEEVAIDRYLS